MGTPATAQASYTYKNTFSLSIEIGGLKAPTFKMNPEIPFGIDVIDRMVIDRGVKEGREICDLLNTPELLDELLKFEDGQALLKILQNAQKEINDTKEMQSLRGRVEGPKADILFDHDGR